MIDKYKQISTNIYKYHEQSRQIIKYQQISQNYHQILTTSNERTNQIKQYPIRVKQSMPKPPLQEITLGDINPITSYAHTKKKSPGNSPRDALIKI